MQSPKPSHTETCKRVSSVVISNKKIDCSLIFAAVLRLSTMTFNENPFHISDDPVTRRSDSDGLNLLADVIDNGDPIPGVSSKPPSSDTADDNPSSKKKKKKTILKNPPSSPKSPPKIPLISQTETEEGFPPSNAAGLIPTLSETLPGTPKHASSKRTSKNLTDETQDPVDSPDTKKDSSSRIFETPKQFYARMARVLPRKECPKVDLYLHPFPLDAAILDKFSKIDCDAWSDSFCDSFHLSIESDPACWTSLVAKFDQVKNLTDFQSFLEIHSKRHPLAFLGFDRKKNPMVIHNIFVSPDSGSVLAPEPVFLCFTKDSLDVPPGTFDSEELTSILKSLDYSRVPTLDEILSGCLTKDKDSLAGLSLKASTFSDFAPYLSYPEIFSDKPEDVQYRKDHAFECKSIVLLPPSIAGDIIRLIDPDCHFPKKGPNAGSPKSSPPSIPELVEFIFSKILSRWRRSFENPIGKPSTSKFDSNDPHCIRFSDTIRFLWGVHRGKIIVDDLFLDHPSNYGSAMTAVEFYFKTSLPDRSTPMYATSRGPRPPAAERSGNFSLSKSRRSQDPLIVENDSMPSPPVSKDVLYLTTQMTKSMSEQFSKTISDQRDQLSQAITQQSNILKSQEERHDHFKTFTIDTRNAIILGQVGPHSTCLPTTPSEKAKEIFKQKNTHNLYTTIHSQIFRRADNTCFLIFGQVGVIQKYGLKWRSDEHPGGFSPFSFDPNNHSGASNHQALDHDIHQDIFESSLRHSNGLSTKDMKDIFTDDKLFFPLTLDHYGTQLNSYLCFAQAIWGEDSFIVLNIRKMYTHLSRHRRVYLANQADDSTFFSRLLFSLDNSIQNFITDNLEDATCLEDISGEALDYHTNKLCNKVISKEDICRMPRFLLSAVQTKHRNENNPNCKGGSNSNNKRNADSKLPGAPPGALRSKRGRTHESPSNDTNHAPPVRPSFDFPSAWKIPSDIRYGKAFPRTVLNDVPSLTVEGSSKQFCVKFFALQACRNGDKCYFSHADPAQYDKTDALNAFFEKAYDRARRNT